MDTALLDLDGLQRLVDVLLELGYTVLGPTVHEGAIVHGPITRIEQLPRGWGDSQEAGSYRLRRRDDEALFGFANGPQSAKPVFFPTEQLLWRSRRNGDDVAVEEAAERPPYAVIGLRSCDLHAIGIHDTVLAGRGSVDVHYAAAREDSFVVAVACSDPGGTCFCVSMGTGPKPEQGRGAAFDLALTELLDEGPHRFLVEVGSMRGAEVVARLAAAPATEADKAAAEEVARVAAGRMGRTLDTRGLKELLYESVDSPQWDDVATRCLACTNCTAVCPTCFCTTVDDVTDLSGDATERTRVWDSCFNADFSYIHGGTVRGSTRSRYRQWMTHKLAAWVDQFGMSGCVGCGRCITWCPAAIDITAEAAAIRDRSAGDS
jgi:ferredoxin